MILAAVDGELQWTCFELGYPPLHGKGDVTESHVAMGKELGVPIDDASYAYIRYFGEKPSTERLESLFAKDRAHPGLWGSYIYSCLLYSAITNRSPVGLAAPEAIPADVTKTLQETAWAQHQETTTALKTPLLNR